MSWLFVAPTNKTLQADEGMLISSYCSRLWMNKESVIKYYAIKKNVFLPRISLCELVTG